MAKKAAAAVVEKSEGGGQKKKGGRGKAVGVPRYVIRRILRNFVRDNVRCVFDKKSHDMLYQLNKQYVHRVFVNALESLKLYRKAPRSLNSDRLAIAASRVRVRDLVSKVLL